MGKVFTKMAGDGAHESSDGQGHNPFIVRHARVWSRASTVQLVPGSSAAVLCSLSLKAIATARKILQADV